MMDADDPIIGYDFADPRPAAPEARGPDAPTPFDPVAYRRSEIAEAVRRLIVLVCDPAKVTPETADALYLTTAISELEKWSAALTPALLSVEDARRNLDMVFMWRDRKTDEGKTEYRAAVDALVAAALRAHPAGEPRCHRPDVRIDTFPGGGDAMAQDEMEREGHPQPAAGAARERGVSEVPSVQSQGGDGEVRANGGHADRAMPVVQTRPGDAVAIAGIEGPSENEVRVRLYGLLRGETDLQSQHIYRLLDDAFRTPTGGHRA